MTYVKIEYTDQPDFCQEKFMTYVKNMGLIEGVYAQ